MKLAEPGQRCFGPVGAAALLLGAVAAIAGPLGCTPRAEQEVVVYAALDREFSETILGDFEQQSGIRVRPKYDVESTKTVGLVTEIIQEQNRPRCDLFWNNEILHTLRLQKLGLLEAYPSPAAEPFPENYRGEKGEWHGLAARARVLLVNTDLVAENERPTSIEDLAHERWQGKAGLAKPLFGTTATHAAVLFTHWGDERAREYFDRVHSNAKILGGNKQVAEAVSRGEISFGLTDTDDAIIEVERGRPVTIVFPDQGEGQVGTLFIPNTLCLIKGSPNPTAARRLVDYLLSPAVEQRLAAGPSAQFPVNPKVQVESRAAPDTPIRWMEVDFQAAADEWETASEYLREKFGGGS